MIPEGRKRLVFRLPETTSCNQNMLERIIDTLRLREGDREKFFDLAGKARSISPPDLTEYINRHEAVRVALRAAKEKASDDDWRKFLHDLEKKE